MRPRITLLILCAVVVWIAGALPVWSATRHVLLLYDERVDLPGLAALGADLVGTLVANSKDRIEVYREEMDLSRFDSDDYRSALRNFLRAKYADRKLDVAVAILGPSLDFLLEHGAEIFPGTPIVFCGVDRRELGDRPLPPHVRGVLVKREFAPTLEIALRIHPDTTRVVVVAGESAFDRRLLDQARSEFRAYDGRVAFTYLTAGPLQDMLAKLARLPPHTIVLYTTFFQDSTGAAFVTHDVAQRISEAASAPVYGFLDQYLGRGIVGGSLYSLSAHGAETARLVLRILANSDQAEPRLLETSANKALFDWRQMARWGISASSLPSGSEIRFRDPTVWDQYGTEIGAILLALLLQAALISWLLYEHRRRNLAEIRSRESIAELTYLNRRAGAGELSASIAHEVNQPLTAISVTASAGLKWLRRETPDLREAEDALEDIVKAAQRAGEVVKSVRAMYRKETQVGLVDLDEIAAAVLELARIELLRSEIAVQTQFGQLPAVTGDAIQLRQVVLNLIMNAIEAMRSATSRVLRVKTEATASSAVRLSIEDTGAGIDPSDIDRIFKPMFTTKAGGIGMGLSICQTIIENHDGRIWAEARPGGGATFQFELPIAPTPIG
jgi:signal transduction histidine kinase